MNEQEYLQDRVEKQQKYFSNTAMICKKRYYIFSVAKLIASLIITALSSANYDSPCSIIIAILSLLVAFTEGILLLFKYRESWVMHRITSEKIKSEENLYKTRAGEYYKTKDEDAFNILVQNIESIIQSNNSSWEGIHKSKRGDN